MGWGVGLIRHKNFCGPKIGMHSTKNLQLEPLVPFNKALHYIQTISAFEPVRPALFGTIFIYFETVWVKTYSGIALSDNVFKDSMRMDA